MKIKSEIEKMADEALSYLRWAESMLDEVKIELGNHKIKGFYRDQLVDQYYYLEGYIKKVRIHLKNSLYSAWSQYHVNTVPYDRGLILSL